MMFTNANYSEQEYTLSQIAYNFGYLAHFFFEDSNIVRQKVDVDVTDIFTCLHACHSHQISFSTSVVNNDKLYMLLRMTLFLQLSFHS